MMKKNRIAIAACMITLLSLIGCRIEQERTNKDPLNLQMLGFHPYYADSLKMSILTNDTIDWDTFNQLIYQYDINSEPFRILPYYLLKLQEDTTGQLCYNIYRATCNNALPEENQIQLKQTGIKYLKLGAALNDSICINELNKINAQ